MPARSRTPAALARAAARTTVATLIAAVAVLLAAAPAQAADVFVEVNPSTVEAGNQIGIRASCPDNKVSAIVRSDAFGQVTIVPQFGFLTAAVRIPVDRRAGTYAVRLSCPEGSQASVQLHVVNRTRPSRGPATGFGGTAGGGSGRLLVGGGLVAILAGACLGLLTLRRRRTG